MGEAMLAVPAGLGFLSRHRSHGDLQSEFKHQVVQRSPMPSLGVGLVQPVAKSVTDVSQKAFKGHEAVAVAQEDPVAEARLVGPGEQPGVVLAVYRVGPERLLATIQGGPLAEEQLGQLSVADAVDGAQRLAQSGFVHFRPPFAVLLSRLGLGHAVFRRLQAVAVGQGAPRARAVALQDDVRVHQNGTGVRRHRGSQFDGAVETMLGEQVADTFDWTFEQRGGAAKRDEALVDGAGHDFCKAP